VGRLLQHRRTALVAVLGAAAAGSLAWGGAGAESERVANTPTSALPRWLAPGGRLVVRGRGTPGQIVRLTLGERTWRTKVRQGGRFVVRGRAPAVMGSYEATVTVERDSIELVDQRTVLVRPLRLAAAGDVNLGDRVGTAIATYGSRYPWRSVAPVLRRADIAVANLECAVSTRGSPVPDKEYTFRGAPSSLRAMARYAGVDVISVANNHSLDYGRVAFADTLSHARRFGMTPIGGGRNLAAARRARIVKRGGLRVALLGYSDVRPLGFDAGPSWSGAAPAFPSYIAADVRKARQHGADAIVVYFHWGVELSTVPNAQQRALAAVAFDAGATVVLGAHPHVLQPREMPRRRRLVAWSLGNFVFGAHSRGTASTGILRVRLGRAGVLGYGFSRARIGGPFSVQPILQ
jgi:poly-gamma-glutamate capsule biosynthesis protein CapA/YwtB (metallophosphatase superfamily)